MTFLHASYMIGDNKFTLFHISLIYLIYKVKFTENSTDTSDLQFVKLIQGPLIRSCVITNKEHRICLSEIHF